MIRDAILKSKRDELGNCITSRKRKLQELYHATVSYARPLPQKHKPDANDLQTYGEAEFLDANNVLEGKFFDPSTLRGVPGAELINYNSPVTPSTKPQQRPELPDHETVPASDDSDTIVLQGRLAGGHSVSSKSGREQNENEYLPASNSTSQEAHDDRASVRTDLYVERENGVRDPVVAARVHSPEAGLIRTKKPFSWPSDPQGLDTGSHSKAQALVDDDLNSLEGSITLGTVEDLRGSSLTGTQPSDVASQEQPDNILRLADDSLENFNLKPDYDGKSGSAHDPFKTNGVSKRISQAPATKGSHSAEDINDASENKITDAEIIQDGRPVTESQLHLREPQFLKPTHNLKPRAENETLSSTEGDTINNVQKVDQLDRSCSLVGDSRLLERRSQPFQERMMPGTTREISKDLMFSQRPPMRIDTGVSSQRGTTESLEKSRLQGSLDSQTPSSSSTPLKATPATAHPSPPERMTTRVSSGALRHKSVSEILGATPRSGTHQGDKTPVDRGTNDSLQDVSGQQTPKYGQLVTSPESVSFRSRLSELKEREKERSKLSTVVFARQQPLDYSNNSESSVQRVSGSERVAERDKDYLLTLFTAQASAQQPSLNALLGSAHKALTTSNHYLDFHEQQDCRILKRIYHLQNSNRWSLRQLSRSQEPQRPTSQWDVLLAHMKWMQTDFREERKWKLVVAKNLADWCAEWIASSSARRMALQVRPISNGGKIRDSDGHVTPVSLANNVESSRSDTTPELVPAGEDDLSDALGANTPILGAIKTPAPAAIFSLAPEDVIFQLDKTPVSEKLLAELPLYEPWNNISEVEAIADNQSADKSWKTPLLPISKFATGKMIIRSPVPSRKKSRYEFDDDNDDEDEHFYEPAKRPRSTFSSANEPVPPEINDVALFNSENKHIIDRLHAAHAFRPPSEFSMPSQSFFESRTCSQWTWAEDDELRKLVREYAYNWSLISSSLTSPSLFSSGAERRTPWECFERWVSFEGLPGDMNRTQYFRTWYSRRDAARTLLNQQIAAQQQQQAGNSSQAQVRRRTAEPTRVERRRNNKHLALIHAMQKVAKKKETTLQKQLHVASLAAMRKATEATQPRQRMQTPQEFSRFKHERECRMQEKQDLYRQQMLAQQRAAFMQKASQQSGQSQPNPNIPIQARNGISTSMSTSPHLATSLPHGVIPSGAGQNRTIPLPNGILPNGQSSSGPTNMRGGGIPQAPMQSHMLGQQRMPHDMRVILEATRVQQEQQYLAAQRQQRYPGTNGINGTSSSPQPISINTPQANAAMLTNLQATNGKISPAPNGIPAHPRTSASPRLANVVQAQQLSNGVTPILNQIASQMKARHPNASPEQIKQLATDHLNQQYRAQNSQAAMQAAAGSGLGLNGSGTQQVSNFGNTMLNPQMYTQSMHFQQQAQQNHNRVGSMNGVRPPSRDNASQMRNGGTQGGTSHSPRPPQAQVAGSQ